MELEPASLSPKVSGLSPKVGGGDIRDSKQDEERLTIRLVLTAVATMLGTAYLFFNFGSINNPGHIIQAFINETYSEKAAEPITERGLSAIWSIVVAIYPFGALVGSLFTSLVAEKLGRRSGLLLTGAIASTFSLLSGLTRVAGSWICLLVGRFGVGIALGLGSALGPLFITEIAPVRFRGALGILYQTLIAFSDFSSTLFSLPQILGSEQLWPLLMGYSLVPSLFMVVVLVFTPESPRYLLTSRKDKVGALKALTYFHGNAWKAESDVSKLEAADNGGDSEQEQTKYPSATWKNLFARREYRFPLLVSVTSMIVMQFIGVGPIISYSFSIYLQAGLEPSAAMFGTMGLGICNLVFSTLSALVFVERFGRRPMFLTTIFGCATMLSILTALLLAKRYAGDAAWLSWLSIAVIIAWMMFNAIGSGVCWLTLGELFPQAIRSKAATVAVLICWLLAFGLILAYPNYAREVGASYSFIPFIVVLLVCGTILLKIMPETKNRSIDEIFREMSKK